MDRNQLIATFTEDAIRNAKIDVDKNTTRIQILSLIANNDPQLQEMLQVMFRKNTGIADTDPLGQLLHSLDPSQVIPDLTKVELKQVITTLQNTFANEIKTLLKKEVA